MENKKINELAKKAFETIKKRKYHIHAWPVNYNASKEEVYDYINTLYYEMDKISLEDLKNTVRCLNKSLQEEEGEINKQLHSILWCTMMEFFDIDAGNSRILQIGNYKNMQHVLFEIFILKDLDE